MRGVITRGLAGLTLVCWLLAACLSQLVWLHVETEHHGHHHAEAGGPFILVVHDENHGGHEHQVSSVRGPGLSSPRPQALAPVLAYLPVDWSDPPTLRTRDISPIPHSRGSPRLHTVLLI